MKKRKKTQNLILNLAPANPVILMNLKNPALNHQKVQNCLSLVIQDEREQGGREGWRRKLEDENGRRKSDRVISRGVVGRRTQSATSLKSMMS